ncbi:hypothetical protein RUM43_008959 [Polyplax serrata]|uniref:Uncharacterized protein n=1 Tax=Polyplax serrata TaxID=468196 RepID=A0AAN8PB99_POLSC
MTKNGIIIRKRRKRKDKGKSKGVEKVGEGNGCHRPNISIEIIEHGGQLPAREFTTETRCPRMNFPRVGTRWVKPKKGCFAKTAKMSGPNVSLSNCLINI